jgi:imidazolonepropionase-like amidohydrolase
MRHKSQVIPVSRRARATFAAVPLAASLVFLAGPLAAAEDLVAIEVGRIITVSGEEIPGGTILVRDGRLEAVGKDVKAPWDAKVYKFPSGVAMPGLIDCHSTAGLRVPNENVANVPYITVLDGVDPSADSLRDSLRDGITAVHVIPANVTRIGGQGAVVRTKGRTVADLVITSPSAMKLSLQPPSGETRMETMAALRRVFLDTYLSFDRILAEAAPEAIQGPADPAPDLTALLRAAPPWETIDWEALPADKVDPKERPMIDVVRGKLRSFIYCPSASDVFKAFELIDANHLQATLVLGSDAHKAAAVLAAREGLGPVVLDPALVVWDQDPDTAEEERHVNPRALHDAGVRFALQRLVRGARSAFDREPGVHLWSQAAELVRFGIPRDEALRAVTLTPAEILGLGHRMGSLEKGKDANIAVFSGDPLDARSWVDLVLIEGREAYRRDADPDLELLLRDPEKVY